MPFSCVYFGNFSISDLLYSIIQNPADRVPVHVKFKATELFTNKYVISLIWPDNTAEEPLYCAICFF